MSVNPLTFQHDRSEMRNAEGISGRQGAGIVFFRLRSIVCGRDAWPNPKDAVPKVRVEKVIK
jgi:hypothetical protein